MDTEKPASRFAYVYVLYYLDVDEESRHERLRDTSPVVYTSLKWAMNVVTMKTGITEPQEISNGHIWKAGNYWIQREPILDVDNLGLEYEISYHDGSGRQIGKLPLKFDT